MRRGDRQTRRERDKADTGTQMETRMRPGRERKIGDGGKRKTGTAMETKVKHGLETSRGGDGDKAETERGTEKGTQRHGDRRQRNETGIVMEISREMR